MELPFGAEFQSRNETIWTTTGPWLRKSSGVIPSAATVSFHGGQRSAGTITSNRRDIKEERPSEGEIRPADYMPA